MAVFKCKMCGGALEIAPGITVCECEYCGTTQTLPKLDDDHKANLYDRANHFRRNNDYDKASAIYEKILNEDNTDAEAYWSLVLCRYGIEYVEDPATHKRIPTVNRAQYTSIYADEDYKAAIQNADATQKAVYEAEAKAIDAIQKGILEISQKEEPFDVFICYKETDANGRRTPDSVLANDLYHQLKQEGFKVFFSRITLEDKLGTAYEPYIFAALNSAKVMVVLGTKPEYFNAVWVKNEWSRYLALIRGGAKKMLIPAYRDMDPYDLPEEFSHLQAQDMSKLGFMQDLIRGIKKIAAAYAPKTTVVRETVAVQNAAQANTLPLLERAFLFLEDSKWQDANIYCEKVLDIDPKNAEAYLGKLMAELHVKKRGQLEDCEKPFDDRDNYSKVIRFGDETLENEMRAYIEHINERNERSRLVNTYNSAVDTMQKADSEEKYKAAEEAFRSIAGFKDSDALAEECAQKAQVCHLEAERKAEEKRIAAEKAAKKRKKAFMIGTPIVCVCIALAVALNTVVIPTMKYNAASKQLSEGHIVEAYEGFVALEGYKDSAEKADELYNQYRIMTANVGETVFFGKYEQDNSASNGKEDVEWIILAKENEKVLVISKYALDCQRYNSTEADVTWENCSLRTWLNDTFLNDAFSTKEQAIIATTTVSADENAKYKTNAGNTTSDKVFLLGITEAEVYLESDLVKECVPTAYAKAQGGIKDKGNHWWWLRTPGMDLHHATYEDKEGSVEYRGHYVDCNDGCVRPAMWINLGA